MAELSAGKLGVAVVHLKMARDFLEEGGAGQKTRDQVRKALKSVEKLHGQAKKEEARG
ncbi:hypothetical protein [Aureimonas sp. AU40]|uniref:hypothetical protein n=1 Tax=Aureimonas sp. AU40 TaxID=1637747 RepID=UPI000AEFD7D1|nr:hypothetical protein [Aureimonas sp. AU40]